jgi:hypothetical protein
MLKSQHEVNAWPPENTYGSVGSSARTYPHVYRERAGTPHLSGVRNPSHYEKPAKIEKFDIIQQAANTFSSDVERLQIREGENTNVITE